MTVTTTTSTILPAAGTWQLDKSHSSVEFLVRHLMVSKVRGSFEDFDGTIVIGETPEQSSVEATISLASVNTGDAKRDEHLRSGEFFDVEKNPSMTFKSRAVRPDGDTYKVDGDLTILGVTKPVTLDVEFNGLGQDPWGGTRAGFSATAEISRKDFGLEWNVALESGVVLVGDKVKIELEIQAVQQ
jgi:polyisoprenoid-binding protein YceI